MAIDTITEQQQQQQKEFSTPLSNSRMITNSRSNSSSSSGKFTDNETNIIKNAIQDYCYRKNISISRLCSECDHKSELKGAWLEISKQLPYRTVQSIYRHGIRQCHPFTRGPWTTCEKNLLLDLVSSIGKKWSIIQLKLNRSADSCRDKYRELSDEYMKGRSNTADTLLLLSFICQYLINPTTTTTTTTTTTLSNNSNSNSLSVHSRSTTGSTTTNESGKYNNNNNNTNHQSSIIN